MVGYGEKSPSSLKRIEPGSAEHVTCFLSHKVASTDITNMRKVSLLRVKCVCRNLLSSFVLGKPFSDTGYTKWGTNEPGGGVSENCMAVFVDSGVLVDTGCGSTFAFYCEKET